MNKIYFLKKETFLMTHRCYFCGDTKRVGFVIAMGGGQAFSICQECGEEIINRLNLREVSKSIWALPEAT